MADPITGSGSDAAAADKAAKEPDPITGDGSDAAAADKAAKERAAARERVDARKAALAEPRDYTDYASAVAHAERIGKGATVEPVGTAFHVAIDGEDGED